MPVDLEVNRASSSPTWAEAQENFNLDALE